MFRYPFLIFVNYLILLQCGFVNTQADVINYIMITFLRALHLILTGLKIPFDQTGTHFKITSSIIIMCFNLGNIPIQIETPARTTQRAFICTGSL